MPNVVGVRFKRAGKVYYFDPAEWEFRPKDPVIVETARGIEFGTVVSGSRAVPDEEIVTPLKKVIRPATEADVVQVEENRQKEREAASVAKEKIVEHGLEMDLVDVEYTFDRSKVIFYFTAEGRVDFRELVRDLAGAFRTRIELRQIGVRDEAKLLGGLGSCGRELCCATFLGDFAPVSIKMAKEQNLALNPVKISGLCGRLMCCLRYESGQYEEGKAALPEVGSTVVTAQGDGRVDSVNVLRNVVSVVIEGKGLVDFPPEELEVWKPGAPRPAVPQPLPRDTDRAAGTAGTGASAAGDTDAPDQFPMVSAAGPAPAGYPRPNGGDGRTGEVRRRERWADRVDRSARVTRSERRPGQPDRAGRDSEGDHGSDRPTGADRNSNRGGDGGAGTASAVEDREGQSRRHRHRRGGRAEGRRTEGVRTDSGRGESERGESGRGESGRGEGGRADAGRAQGRGPGTENLGGDGGQRQGPSGGGSANVPAGTSGTGRRRHGGRGSSGSRRHRPDRRNQPGNGASPPSSDTGPSDS